MFKVFCVDQLVHALSLHLLYDIFNYFLFLLFVYRNSINYALIACETLMYNELNIEARGNNAIWVSTITLTHQLNTLRSTMELIRQNNMILLIFYSCSLWDTTL